MEAEFQADEQSIPDIVQHAVIKEIFKLNPVSLPAKSKLPRSNSKSLGQKKRPKSKDRKQCYRDLSKDTHNQHIAVVKRTKERRVDLNKDILLGLEKRESILQIASLPLSLVNPAFKKRKTLWKMDERGGYSKWLDKMAKKPIWDELPWNLKFQI